MAYGTMMPPVSVSLDTVPEGYIIDYLTDKRVRDTPEEYVRQNIERALVKQYRYNPNDCRPEYSIKMGSAKPRVDIVIFEPGAKQVQENARILIETKKAGTNLTSKKDGIGQLHSYMSACPNVKYGMWTNGDDRLCFARRESKGRSFFDEIVDIPIFGQSEEDTYRPKRRDLMPATADNLLFAFRRCHNYIAGAEGLHKTESFWELLKLIFCKIEDERSNVLDFYITPTELQSSIKAGPAKARLQKIMKEKVVKKYSAIFSGTDQDINLKANVVAFVVSQLHRYSLLASPVDVKGIAYEEIVGSNLRGDRGEFFTPRNACRMAVEMLNPQPFERLLDPACGTGGFLITAMNHALANLWQQEADQWKDRTTPTSIERDEFNRKRSEYLSEYVFGLDLNPSLVRASKMNMVMNNDGEGNLYQVDSLSNPHTWNSQVAIRTPPSSIDLIFTNPPFGANIVIDDEDILSQYDLAARWDKQPNGAWKIRVNSSGEKVLQKSQPPEILFIERCVQLLKKGTGRMAMVVPNGILNNAPLGYIRQWIRHNTQIIAVVDMARDLFQPKNDTQTSMILLRRLSDEQRELAIKEKLDYPVFMAVTDKIGHDKRGNTIYRQAPNGDDLVMTRTEEVTEIDPKTGELQLVKLEVKDRVIDDELPEVAAAFIDWLKQFN